VRKVTARTGPRGYVGKHYHHDGMCASSSVLNFIPMGPRPDATFTRNSCAVVNTVLFSYNEEKRRFDDDLAQMFVDVGRAGGRGLYLCCICASN
jgi:hypothetical protein